MDLTSAMATVNWLSVLMAAISAFLVGGIWYGPLFGKVWMQEFGFSEDDLKKRKPLKTFGLSLFLSFFAALILEMFIGKEANFSFGLGAGLLAGLGWVLSLIHI